MGRQAVIGLAIVAALLALVTAAVFGRDWITDLSGNKNRTPSVMILTSTVLEQAAAINKERRSQAEKGMADQIAGKVPKAGVGQNASLGQDGGENFSLAVQAMQESLDGKVSQDIDNSRRFTLVPAAKITDALIDYAREVKQPPQNLLQFMSGGMATRTSTAPSANPKGKTDQQAGVQGASTVISQGVTTIARKVRADYTLIVTIGEPRFAWDVLPAGNGLPQRVYMVAQPEVNCEIFDSKTNRAYRFANQLAKPISETVVVDPQLPLSGQILTKLTRLDDRVSDAASKQVLALILDKIAPARIVQAGSRIIINRGTNDGVREGAVYNVKREVGETIREEGTGADLGKSRIDVGSIVVASAETATATVSAASGGPFLKGDVLVMTPPVSPSDRNTPSPQPAPGRPGAAPPNLAVDHVRLDQADSQPLGLAVSNVLASEPGIAVLPRAEMENLRSEAAHNSQASGDFGASAEEGMRQSGYLVSGDCSTSARRHSSAVSIGGVSETVSSSVRTTAACTLRALSVDGRLIGSAQGDGGTAQAAAEAAARALLARILPTLGVTSAAPPPAAQPQPVAPAASAAPTPAARPAHAASRPKPRAEPQDSGVHF